MSRAIELDAPNLGEREKELLCQAIDSGFVSTIGPFVSEFEARFTSFLGAPAAVATQSGTAAIHVALREAGIGPGDEVIVPELSFIATVNPVTYVGATPVFADVSRETWNIDPDDIERKITRRTRAIIPVHLYGNPCDMVKVLEIAHHHRLSVIEDATESLGATVDGRQTGTLGDFGCFSFNGNKTITTGGGGMVAGSTAERVDHIRFLVNQARDESQGYFHPEIGFNYRMTNLQAAMGLAQMERLLGFLHKKSGFNAVYRQELGSLDGVHFQESPAGCLSSYWLTCVVLERVSDISGLQATLRERGVPTRRIFMPLTEHPPYRNQQSSGLKNARQIFDRGLCLPSSSLNNEDDIAWVCQMIKEVV